MKISAKKKIEIKEKLVEKMNESVEMPATSLVQEPILQAPSTENVKLKLSPKVYPVPETKEDYLALHKLLQDIGTNSIGDLEVRASKM